MRFLLQKKRRNAMFFQDRAKNNAPGCDMSGLSGQGGMWRWGVKAPVRNDFTKYMSDGQKIKRIADGQRIRGTRQRAGITLDIMANLCLVNQSTLNRIETGKTPSPNVSLMSRIAEVLGVSIESLLKG
jgi:DNA-binding XRE family transcriptional regulator